MASNYHIQKPYVVAALPRSPAEADSHYSIGEVFGQRPGAKKRRRTEVVIGIDGESANIYDIASSRLITSYPIPPQAKFSCPPCSLRLRSAASKKADVARYTYIATREPARKLSLFKDSADAAGATASTATSISLPRSSAIVSLFTLSGSPPAVATKGEAATAATPSVAPLTAPDLLAVDRSGQVTCFDGETLQEKYSASVAALSQDLLPRGATLSVEFAQLSLAADALKGLQLGADYLSGYFSQAIDADRFNPDVLAVITTIASRQGGATRHLHLLAVNPCRQSESQSQSQSSSAPGRQALLQVHHMRLPEAASTPASPDRQITYRLDVLSGSLFSLDGETVVSYDLARSVPQAVGRMTIPGITSFLRLSKSSILASTAALFSVYNPVFKSLQASTTLDLPRPKDKTEAAGGETGPHYACSFVSFFPQLELAVALVDANLVAVQLEPPRSRSKKRRADGLLIDSIGRGVLHADAAAALEDSLPDTCLPGTVSSSYLAQYQEDVQTAQGLLEKKDIAGFDELLAAKLGIQSLADWRWQRPLDAGDVAEAINEAHEDKGATVNGTAKRLTNGGVQEEEEPAAAGPLTNGAGQAGGGVVSARTGRIKYPEADRRWVVYAIGRALSIEQEQEQPGGLLRLQCTLPQSRIVNYLVDAGHLSVANARSALRASLQDVDDADTFLGDELPGMLARVDPSLDLLLRWLYATKLGATELLSSILLLMRSLELPGVGGDAPKLLTNGTAHQDSDDSDDKSSTDVVDQEMEDPQELDRLDQQLHLAEYFLKQVENDPRDLALDIAIGKLGSCPAVATVLGLRRLFKTEEIRSLIEMLRKQLVNQGWATRYVDAKGSGSDGDDDDNNDNDNDNDGGAGETPLNYSIRLIADLLCRCIDSVRPGEWLLDDEPGLALPEQEDTNTNTINGGGDFFALLKWQVSAALEGVQEALYLRGLLGEAVRYATGVQAMAASERAPDGKVRPTRVEAPPTAFGGGMLPLGLKPPVGLSRHDDIAPTKVVSGGEVVKRSRRELGHLTSKKVGTYTLERIVL